MILIPMTRYQGYILRNSFGVGLSLIVYNNNFYFDLVRSTAIIKYATSTSTLILNAFW